MDLLFQFLYMVNWHFETCSNILYPSQSREESERMVETCENTLRHVQALENSVDKLETQIELTRSGLDDIVALLRTVTMRNL